MRDLGGDVSTQQLALVDLAMLLVNSLPAYVLSMPSPVNRQRQCLHPVVRGRQALVNQLQSILRDSAWSAARSPFADLGLLPGAADGGDPLAARTPGILVGRRAHARPAAEPCASHRQTHECVRPKGWQRIPTGQVPLHAGNTPPPHVSNVVVVLGGRVVVVLVVVDVQADTLERQEMYLNPINSTTAKALSRQRLTAMTSRTRKWRNWQTRRIQDPVG